MFLLVKFENIKSKFLFKDEKYNDFLFVKHSKCVCMFCESLRGFYCLGANEFEENTVHVLPLKYKTFTEPEVYQETFLAILQYIFDISFSEDGLFITNNIMPLLADILFDYSISYKLKVPIFLYVNHLLLYERGFSNLLLAMDFFTYHEHFLSSFMHNFNLESFRFFQKSLTLKKEITSKVLLAEKEDTNEKILDTVSRKKGQKGKTIINQDASKQNNKAPTNKIVYPTVSWNVESKKFEKCEKEITEEEFNQFENEEKDQVIGKMSKYFWRLHGLYHLLKILQDFLKNYQSPSKDFIQQQFKDFVFQIVETTIIFNKFNDKYLPTEPFDPDTECWNEVRNILAEIMVLYNFTFNFYFLLI